MRAAFDEYAERHDVALDKGLSLSGESKEFFAQARFLFFFPRVLAPLRPLEAALRRLPAAGPYMVLSRKVRQ